MTCEKEWEEMRRAEMRWHQVRRNQMIWDEMTPGMWSASAKCECGGWSVQSEVWRKCSLDVALQRGRAQVMFLDSNSATSSHKARTRGPGWRTARANSIDERGLTVKSKAPPTPPRAGTTGNILGVKSPRKSFHLPMVFCIIYVSIYMILYVVSCFNHFWFPFHGCHLWQCQRRRKPFSDIRWQCRFFSTGRHHRALISCTRCFKLFLAGNSKGKFQHPKQFQTCCSWEKPECRLVCLVAGLPTQTSCHAKWIANGVKPAGRHVFFTMQSLPNQCLSSRFSHLEFQNRTTMSAYRPVPFQDADHLTVLPDTEECRALHREVEEWDPQQRVLAVKAVKPAFCLNMFDDWLPIVYGSMPESAIFVL